jgi:hypothetical protein
MRSPLAPKKMTLHGSWMRFESIPARNGFGRARGAGNPGRMSVADAELSDIDDLPSRAGARRVRLGVRAHALKSDHPVLHELPFLGPPGRGATRK